MPYKNRIVVGSEEWCSLPDLGIPVIKVRVDSGAKTSSLHAFNIREFKRAGAPWVSFELHPIQNNRITIVRCEAAVLDQRKVKSSSGEASKRFVIATTLDLFEGSWRIEVTLTNRDPMGYRMLLGREAMQDRILVDPSNSFHCGKISDDEVNKRYGYYPENIAGLNIGLLASNPDLYSNQRIMAAAASRGHNIQFFDIRQCFIKLDAESPEIYCRDKRKLSTLDAIIPRIRSSLTSYGCALVRQFENLGVYSLNSAQAIGNARDKLYALQALVKSGLEIPATGYADTSAEAADLFSLVEGAPLVIKIQHDQRGQQVMLAQTQEAAKSTIAAVKSAPNYLLVQEFINEAEGKDLRLFIVNNRVVGSVQRKLSTGKSTGNIHHSRKGTSIRISKEERQLALKAAKTLGLTVAGVDIIRSRRGPLLLDVNSSPGLEEIERVSSKDIAAIMIAAIEKRLGWKRQVAKQNHQTAKSG
jgi:ribosomal protein S6--L-glutamate ligase